VKASAFRIFDNYQKISIMIAEFFIQTASSTYVARWGSFFGIELNPATIATGNIVFTGVDTTTIPINTTLQSASGISYATSAASTISTSTVTASSVSRLGTTVTVNFTSAHGLASGIIIDSITGATPSDFNGTNLSITVTSSKQFQYTLSGTAGTASGTISAQWTTASVLVTSSAEGDDTNVAAGGLLTLSSPISGVTNSAYVDINEISGGTDVEDESSYRTRVLYRVQYPFSFFNTGALVTQAKKISGVTRVWVFSPNTTSSSISISAIVRNDQIATATKVNHGLVDGSYITITGAVETEYNVIDTRVIVIDADTFAYVVSGSPSTPATGTIAASYSYVEEGQVRIGFTRDNDTSIIPSSTEVNIVRDKILEIKPAHMSDDDVIVFAPVAVPVAITFSSFSPSTVAMKTAISSALDAYFRISNNIGQNIKLADLNGVLNQVIDSTGTVPTYTLSVPSGNTTIGLNEIGTLGVITY
tara:strand:+ start:22385 stop:23812 length:1428 start_codon:yes stop_codon:yes gene_type:complete